MKSLIIKQEFTKKHCGMCMLAIDVKDMGYVHSRVCLGFSSRAQSVRLSHDNVGHLRCQQCLDSEEQLKARTGFVSNSSSSSFVVKKANLNDMQLFFVRNFVEAAKDEEYGDCAGDWEMIESDDEIRFSTIMDNLDLGYFFEKNGIGVDYIEMS